MTVEQVLVVLAVVLAASALFGHSGLNAAPLFFNHNVAR